MSAGLLLSYRATGLGGLLAAAPALRALRTAFSDHQHALVAPAWLAPIVRALDAVDRHVALSGDGGLPMWCRGAAVAVDLGGGDDDVRARLLAASQPRLFIGPRTVDGGGSEVTEGEVSAGHEAHETVRLCRRLERHGIPTDPGDLEIEPPAGPVPLAGYGATLVHPGAGSASRRWAAERFAAVARAERDRGRHVLITGSREERWLGLRVAADAGLSEQAVLAGKLDLGGFARLVEVAGRVVCNDSGVVHLATALQTPSVCVYGARDPARWGPPPDRRDRHRVLWGGRRDHEVAGSTPDLATEVEVDDVLGELRVLDDRERARHPSNGRFAEGPARQRGEMAGS